MHFNSIYSYILAALSCMSLPTTAAPTDRFSEDNMVHRTVTTADGTLATVYINRNLDFVTAPKGTASTQLSKRLAFTPGNVSNYDYCSETDPNESFGSDAPLAKDCEAIKTHMEQGDGYYTVAPKDFKKSTGWATIASSGTCSFAIQFQNPADTKQVVIGTNDVHFYIQGYVGDAQNGKIKAIGTISCNNDQKLLFLFWGMIHS